MRWTMRRTATAAGWPGRMPRRRRRRSAALAVLGLAMLAPWPLLPLLGRGTGLAAAQEAELPRDMLLHPSLPRLSLTAELPPRPAASDEAFLRLRGRPRKGGEGEVGREGRRFKAGLGEGRWVWGGVAGKECAGQ